MTMAQIRTRIHQERIVFSAIEGENIAIIKVISGYRDLAQANASLSPTIRSNSHVPEMLLAT
jgi:hypothetical protein